MPAIQYQVLIRAGRATIYRALTSEGGRSSWWTTDCTARPEVGFVNVFRFGDLIRNEMTVVGDTETYDYGKFGWIMDPEGNKIELWEPDDEVFRRRNRLG